MAFLPCNYEKLVALSLSESVSAILIFMLVKLGAPTNHKASRLGHLR